MSFKNQIQKHSAPFRAQTVADVELPDWNEFRYIDRDENPDIRYWQPGSKKKSFDNGELFVYRITPECFFDESAGGLVFLPGRNEKGFLSEGTVWPVNVVEKFGTDRMVSFIPTLPYVPVDGKYPPYSSPNDNPYHLLTTMLWRMKSSTKLPPQWRPLVMTTDEIGDYRKKAGLHGGFRSQLLLPLPKWRYFSYALIYRGYNTETNEDFSYDGIPFGMAPEHGLQIVSVNNQAFQDFQREYARRARSAGSGVSDEFYLPDPAEPQQGMLNYVWNRKFPSPIDSNAGKLEGFGYTGAVENRYHLSPGKFEDVALELPGSFLAWYGERWRHIAQVLKGTVGTELVRMIAQFAPELREPCKLAWQRHPALMQAWEDAFADAPVDYDFYETLEFLYGTHETEHPTAPNVEPGLPEAFLDEMPERPVSRTPSAIDFPGRNHNPANPAVKRTVNPLQAVGERFRQENLYEAQFEDLESGTDPNFQGDEVPF